MLELFGDPKVDSRKVGLLSEKDGKKGAYLLSDRVYIYHFIYVYCVYKSIFV